MLLLLEMMLYKLFNFSIDH